MYKYNITCCANSNFYSIMLLSFIEEHADTIVSMRSLDAALYGTGAACEAVEMLFHTVGASVARRGDRLQRYFRDVQMYRIHVQSQALLPVVRAHVQLGLPIPTPFHR